MARERLPRWCTHRPPVKARMPTPLATAVAVWTDSLSASTAVVVATCRGGGDGAAAGTLSGCACGHAARTWLALVRGGTDVSLEEGSLIQAERAQGGTATGKSVLAAGSPACSMYIRATGHLPRFSMASRCCCFSLAFGTRREWGCALYVILPKRTPPNYIAHSRRSLFFILLRARADDTKRPQWHSSCERHRHACHQHHHPLTPFTCVDGRETGGPRISRDARRRGGGRSSWRRR